MFLFFPSILVALSINFLLLISSSHLHFTETAPIYLPTNDTWFYSVQS